MFTFDDNCIPLKTLKTYVMQAKLITRCSPGRLLNVLKHLTPDQKDSVRSMGFGSLLGLRCRTLRRRLCLWLLERFNTARSSMNIWGVCIPLSPQDVELVLGLAVNGRDVVNSGPDDLIAELHELQHYESWDLPSPIRG